MVKDIGLDCFVVGPYLVVAIDIDLDWQTVLGRLKMSDQESHVLMNFGMIFQVGNDIGPVDADVGLASAVYKLFRIRGVFLIIMAYFIPFFSNIILNLREKI